MLANLLQLMTGRPPPARDYDQAFVQDVTIRRKRQPNRRLEGMILICWLLIVLKSWLMTWLIEKYQVPIDPLWIVAPTVAFALLCTLVYYLRD